jgi:hypothetical protein
MRVRRAPLLLLLAALPFGAASASADPIGWAQPGGTGGNVVLTYSFSNLFDGGFDSQLSADEMMDAAAAAFAIWARYAPLHFFEVPDSGPPPSEDEYSASTHPDIRIGYMATLPEDHVAHAHLPYGNVESGLAGDIHFSNDLSSFGAHAWGNAGTHASSVDFFSAMLHEVGHALGLPHIFDAPAIMGSIFHVFLNREEADLLPGDIAAIRALYGAGVGSVHRLDPALAAVPEPATMLLIFTGLLLITARIVGMRRVSPAKTQ